MKSTKTFGAGALRAPSCALCELGARSPLGDPSLAAEHWDPLPVLLLPLWGALLCVSHGEPQPSDAVSPLCGSCSRRGTAGTRTWLGLCFPRLWPADGSRAQATGTEGLRGGRDVPFPSLPRKHPCFPLLSPASQGTLQPGEEPVRGRALPGPNPCQAGEAVQPPRGEPVGMAIWGTPHPGCPPIPAMGLQRAHAVRAFVPAAD